jgi:hypothetical protein
MKRALSLLAVTSSALLLPALAALGAPGEPPAFLKSLFPPDVIVRHGTDIGLPKAQRSAITKVVSKTQPNVLEIQWDMQDAARQLTALMGAAKNEET